MKQTLTFQQTIYWLVQQIPLGRVATYGQIAALCGWPRHARYVGYALYQVAPDSEIPWHRVVNAQGKISYAPQRQGTDELQRWRLEAEGIIFERGDRIRLSRYQWQPSATGDSLFLRSGRQRGGFGASKGLPLS